MTNTQQRKRKRRANPHSADGFCLRQFTYRAANGKKTRSPRWSVRFRDHLRTWRELPAFTDKSATVTFARNLRKLADQRAVGQAPTGDLAAWIDGLDDATRGKFIGWGMLNEQASNASKPLSEHINDWHNSILDDGSTADHASLVKVRVKRIINGCHFQRFTDFTELAVQRYLAERGGSIQTRNHYCRAVKQFAAWMVRHGRAASSPIGRLRMLKVTDKQERRAISVDQLRQLIATAEKGSVRGRMSGPDRATLYWLASETGFRASELRSLKASSFKLDTNPPTVTVQAGYAKNRRRDTLAITDDLAARVRRHLANKLPAAPAFTMPTKQADMLRFDLERAGIPYVDGAGDRFDFHALRVQCASNLARGGAHPAVAQARMRHSTIKLTMDIYTKLGQDGQQAALDAMPKLSATG